MRRITGMIDGVPYEVLESNDGQVECSGYLRDQLEQDDGSLPTGADLEQACRLLFGNTLQVEEIE